MKYLIKVVMFLFIALTDTTSQTVDTLRKTRYGLELSQFITESGFNMGTELYITVIPDHRKNISLGLYFCTESKKISGLIVHHEITLIKNPDYRTIVPYAFYNMIYRITRTREVLADKDIKGEYVYYKSLEHHLGIGIRVVLPKDFTLKCALGYGVYMGSIKKPSKPLPVTGEIAGTNGFGAIAKLGICIKL